MNKYEELLNIIKTEPDLERFLTHESDWEYLFNLSKIRWNVLEWFDFDAEGALLELGAGCGALSGLFSERLQSVVALTATEEEKTINQARNGEYDNLTIMSEEEFLLKKKESELSKENRKQAETSEEKALDENPSAKDGENLQEISRFQTDNFDYVTIIGNFTLDKLQQAAAALKTGGTLIIATDNKYAMKYWSGDERPEDTTLYTKSQLLGQIKYRGFDNIKFYYPIPDYIFPMEIYSEKNLPKKGDIRTATPSYLKDKILTLDEVKTFDMVIEDHKFEEYANSFIVVAQKR